MDPVNVIQLVFAGTAALIFGRVGLAFARYVERRLSGSHSAHQEAESRLRALEDECAQLRLEVGELHERQDFTERLLAAPPEHTVRAGSGATSARPNAPE
jgi:hypothetical protein